MTQPGTSLGALLSADGLAAAFDEERWTALVEQVMETLDVGPGTTVFDAGCGAGAFLHPLSLNGYIVGGVDPSPDRIALARAAMPGGRFIVGPAIDFSPVDAWDVVTSSRGFADCEGRDEVRALLARMAAKATHAIAVLRVEEERGGVSRAMLLRLLAEIGVSAVQFEHTAEGRVQVFARV